MSILDIIVKVVSWIYHFLYDQSPVLQLLVGVAAFWIAGMEFKRLRREKKLEKQRIKEMQAISDSLTAVHELLDFDSRYKKAEEDDEKNKDDKPSDLEVTDTTGNKMVIEIETPRKDADRIPRAYLNAFFYRNLCIENALENIEQAYTLFVKNEEKFAMSYGYNRFIDAFRNVVTLKYEYENSKSAWSYDEMEKRHKEMKDEIIKLIPYIREIQIKYPPIKPKGSKSKG